MFILYLRSRQNLLSCPPVFNEGIIQTTVAVSSKSIVICPLKRKLIRSDKRRQTMGVVKSYFRHFDCASGKTISLVDCYWIDFFFYN